VKNKQTKTTNNNDNNDKETRHTSNLKYDSFAPKLQSNKINVIEFRTREQKNFIQNFKSIWRVLTLEYCKWQERSLR